MLRLVTALKLPRRMVLPYLRIATKEFLGFGSVLLMLAIVSLLAVRSIDRSIDELAASSNTVDVVDSARAIDRSFVELVRRVREYAWVGKEDAVEAATSLATRIKEQVASRLEQAANDDEQRRFDSLLRFTSAYIETLDHVVALKRSRAEAIRNDVAPNGVAVAEGFRALIEASRASGEDALSDLAWSSLARAMDARIAVTQALDHADTAAETDVDKAWDALGSSLDKLDAATKSSTAHDAFARTATAVAAYRKAYDDAASTDHQLHDLLDHTMASNATAVMSGASSIRDIGVGRQQVLAANGLMLAQQATKRIVGVAAGGLALGMIIATLITWSIVGPIRRVTRAIGRLAEGGHRIEVPVRSGRGEISAMCHTLVALRQTVAQAFGLSQMVQEMPISVMTCDPAELKVTFVNRAARDLLRHIEQALPVPVEQIEGSSMEVLHPDPQARHALFDDPGDQARRGRIVLGGETIELHVSAIRDTTARTPA